MDDEKRVIEGSVALVGPVMPIVKANDAPVAVKAPVALDAPVAVKAPVALDAPVAVKGKGKGKATPKKKVVKTKAKAVKTKAKAVKAIANANEVALVVRANGSAYAPGVPLVFNGKKETNLTELGAIRTGTLEAFGFVPDLAPMFTKAFSTALSRANIVPCLTPASGQSLYWLPPSHKQGGCKMLFAYVSSNKTLTVNHAKTLPFVGGNAIAFQKAFQDNGGVGGNIKRSGGYAEYSPSKGNITALVKTIMQFIG